MAKSSPKKPADDRPISPEERDRLLEPLAGRPLALCVSGGPDSMALMQLVAEWSAAGQHRYSANFSNPYGVSRRRDRRPSKMPEPIWLEGMRSADDLAVNGGPAPVVVLTVNHGLRPEAAEEARFVAQRAAELGLPHQTLEADEPAPATGIQDWARNLRRRLILELLDAEAWKLHDIGLDETGVPCRFVVMAHHLDDQAETVLMRLARGSGLKGLSGMAELDSIAARPKIEPTYSIEAAVLRPLLSVPKSRLLVTLKDRGVEYIEDPSNADDRFERVRMRKALEALQDLGMTPQAIALSANRLRAADASLDSFERRWHRELIDWNDGLLGSVPSPQFAQHGEFAEVRLLATLIATYGGNSRPAELAQVERLRELLMGAEGPFKGSTLGGCRIELDGDYEGGRLLIYREGNGEGLETLPLAPGQTVEWDGGRFRIEADETAPADVEIRGLGASGWAGLKRQVDGLDELKLKAAAMATMTAIWRGAKLISVPFLETRLSKPDIPTKITNAWAIWRSPGADLYKAKFLPNSGF